MTHSLKDPEVIVSGIGILRRIGDESLVGQGRGKVVVKVVVDCRIGDIDWPAFEPVLAYYDGPPLAGLDTLWKQKNPRSEYIRPYIEHHFMACKAWCV